MKTRLYVLLLGVIAQQASAQLLPRTPDQAIAEKRYVTAVTPEDNAPFLLNTMTGDLWKLSPTADEWVYLGDPRGADSGPKGRFQLIPYQTGEVLILDTSLGEAWWTDGTTWREIDNPSTRKK